MCEVYFSLLYLDRGKCKKLNGHSHLRHSLICLADKIGRKWKVITFDPHYFFLWRRELLKEKPRVIIFSKATIYFDYRCDQDKKYYYLLLFSFPPYKFPSMHTQTGGGNYCFYSLHILQFHFSSFPSIFLQTYITKQNVLRWLGNVWGDSSIWRTYSPLPHECRTLLQRNYMNDKKVLPNAIKAK